MAISLDYINKVIARNNANKQAGAVLAPAVSGSKGPVAPQSVEAWRRQQQQELQEYMRQQQAATQARLAQETAAQKAQREQQQKARAQQEKMRREQAYQMELEQRQRDTLQNEQRLQLKLAARSGDKEKNYQSVQAYLANNENARKLWETEHNAMRYLDPEIDRAVQQEVQDVRKTMTRAELGAYDAAKEAYAQYGPLYSAYKGAQYLAGSAATGLTSGVANILNNLIDMDQAARELLARAGEAADAAPKMAQAPAAGTAAVQAPVQLQGGASEAVDAVDQARAQNRAWYEQQQKTLVRPAAKGQGLKPWEELSEEEQEKILETGPYATQTMRRAAEQRENIKRTEEVRQLDMVGGNSLEDLGKMAGTYQQESNQTGAMKVAGDVASGIAGMAPNILANAAGSPALGWGALYASAAGGAAQEARDAGADTLTAAAAGALSGAVEMATEKMFDGIPGMSEGNRFAVSDAVEQGIDRFIKSETGQRVARKLADTLGEGAEEYVSEIAGSYIQQLYQEDERTFVQRATDPDTWYSFLVGSLTSGMMNAGAAAIGAATNRGQQRAAETAVTAENGLDTALASGTQEALTQARPAAEWLTALTRGGEDTAQTIAQQAFGKADEQSVSYVADYIARRAQQGGSQAYSMQDLIADAARDGMATQQVFTREALAAAQERQRAAQNAQEGQTPAQQQEIQETAQSADSEAAGPLEQLVQAMRRQGQTVQQRTGSPAENPLAQLIPGGQAQQTAARAVQVPAAEMQQSAQNAAPVQQEQAEGARTDAQAVQQWAQENETFTPEMRDLAQQSYQPGSSRTLYKTALQAFYDAGRSGSLTFEQAQELNGVRAAAVQQDDVLRRAWELGRQQAATVQDAPGGGRTDGGVTYEEGAQPSAVLDDAVLQAVAAKLGVNVRVMQQLTDDAGAQANGSWAAAMSEIALGENTGNAYQTLAHELTHYMGSYNAEGWARLRNSALEWYARQGGQRTGEALAQYGESYGDYAKGADEAARDVLSGVMSTEDGVRSFLQYLSEDSGYTVQEQRTILQTLREMLDTLIEKVRGLLHGGDATRTAGDARRMAEKADQMEARRGLIDAYLQELETARQGAESGRLQPSAKENAPAASRGAEYSINPEFDREIREWDEEGKNESKIFTLGTTSEALKSIGVRDRSIVMVSDKVRKILRDHPSMTIDMVRQIPAMLENPALVLESRGGSMLPGTKQNSRIVVVGTVTDARGNPVICALDLAPDSRQDIRLGLQDFNKVSSAYAKDRNAGKLLQNSNMLYASPDTKMTQSALSSFGFQFATTELNRLGSIGKITYDGGKVKMQGVPFGEVFGEKRPANAKEELTRLTAERDAWLDSEEVRRVRAAYEQERQMYGLFGVETKNWKSQNPEWQAYERKRKEYNQRISALREEMRQSAEFNRAAAAQRAEARWQEEQNRQRRYDAARQESGLSVEDYHREQAARKYKTTDDVRKAGYLLPDGRMLDFSGGDTRRTVDHREVKDVFGPAELGRDAKPAQYMNRFIAEGNVRVMAETPGVDMSAETPPTRQQLREIEKMADMLGAQKGAFSIDISSADGSQAAAREYSGRVKGSEIVHDIEAFYKNGALPEHGELAQYRYSRKAGAETALTTEQRRRRSAEAESRRLARETTRMADQIELLKQETRLSGGHLMDTKAVHEVAARVVKDANSRYDVAQLERELRRVYESMSRGKVGSVQEAMETLTDLARGVMAEERTSQNYLRETYAPLLDKVRNADWTVRKDSPLYNDLLDAYGDGPGGKTWGNVRKALFGRVNIKLAEEGGASGRIDALFDELAGEWPGVFDREAATVDNIERLMQVYDDIREGNGFDMESGMSADEQAAYMAQDLYDAYLAMPRRQTFADRQAAQAEAVAAQYRKAKSEALAQQRAKFEQALKEQKQWARDRMAELNAQYKAAREAHDQELIIKTQNKIVNARMRNEESILRRRAALELQWNSKRERTAAAQQRQRVQKSVQALHRWLMKPTAQEHVQTKMQDVVLDVLNSLEMNVGRQGTATAKRWQEVMKDIQLMANKAMAADLGVNETDAYADFDPDLPDMVEELLHGTDTLHVAEMNSRQLKLLADVLTSMQTSIRNANRMMSDTQGRTVEQIATDTAREMGKEMQRQLKYRYEWAGKVADSRLGDAAGQLLGLDMMDARRYFASLGDTAQAKIYEPIRKGFDKRVWMLDSAQKAFEEIKGKTDIRSWTGEKAPTQTFDMKTVPDKDGNVEDVKVKLTVGQRMELYNLSQRQQAHEHLMEGGFTLVDSRGKKRGKRIQLTPEKMAEITGSLTNEQVQMAQKLSEYLSAKDGPAGWGNEVSRALYGLDKYTERHYWPIKSDGNYTRTGDATDGATPGFWTIKNQGFTKSLQRHANNGVLVGDAFNTWSDHVANMATYNAWSIPLSDAMKWYNWKSGTEVSTKEQIEGLYGSKGKAYFTTLMKDLNGVIEKPSTTSLDKFARPITRNWKVAKVSANLRVAIQQPTAYIRAGMVMNPKYLAEGLAADVTKLRHGMKMAEEHCAIAKWKSWGYFETNIGQTMRNVLTGQQTTMDRVRDAGTKLAELGDKVTWGTLWNACEAEAKAKGMEPGSEAFTTYCADRLSEIVDKTQVVDSVLHRSHIMRSKNPLAQMSTNFFAEPTKSYSMVAEAWNDMMHGKKGAKANFARATATYALSALGTAAAAALMDAARVTRDEDRDKEYGERYLQNLWNNFWDGVNLLNNIPLVKDMLSIFGGYDATRSDMEVVMEVREALEALEKAKNGTITPYRLTYQVAKALSSLSGLPMGSAIREAKTACDMVTDLQDPLRLDRKMNRDPDDYSYIDLYNQVKAAGGNKDELKALYKGETYAEMLGTAKAASVDAWVQALAKNSAEKQDDGTMKENAAVLPKRLDNEINYTDADGVEHNVVLTGPDYVRYAKAVQQSTVNLIDEYMKTYGKSASTEEQVDYVRKSREYAQETARESVIAGYETDGWVELVQTLSGGQNIGAMIQAREIVANSESDKDADGKTITGSKAANAVSRLQSEMGYTAAQAQMLYNRLRGEENNTYMQLYEDVEGNKSQEKRLAALYGTAGETATYAGMLQNGSAAKVDTYLQELSKTAGTDVLPDRMGASLTVGNEEVELTGQQYVDYAEGRTQTAYNILNELIPQAGSYTAEEQAQFVRYVEDYATQTAKAEISAYEPKKWVQDVEQQARDDSEAQYRLIMAKALVSLAEGKKGENGRTIPYSKMDEAVGRLQDAGYSAELAQQMYKLFS